MRKLMFIVPSISSCRAFLLELLEELTQRRFEVHLVTSLQRIGDDVAVKLPEGVRLHSCNIPRGASPIKMVKALYGLSRLVREHRPNMIHGHFVVGGLLASILGAVHQVSTTVTFHGLHAAGSFGSFLEFLAAQLASQVEVLTEDDAEFLRKRIKRPDRVRALGVPGVGCRMDLFDPVRLNASLIRSKREELGITESTSVFVYVGRLVGFKGYSTAVRAFRKLCAKHEDSYLIILGTADPIHTDGLNDEERAWVQQCPQVYHAGWQDDVAVWLGIGMAMLFPSVREGIPVSVMEAMALGIPPIVVDTRGCRELVRNDDTGMVLEFQDPEMFFEAMSCLVETPGKAVEMGERARVYAVENLSRDYFVDAQCGRYEKYMRDC